MRSYRLPSILAFVLLGAAACSDSTAPAPPLNEAGLTAAISAASATANTQASLSLAILGTHINDALTEDGGALGIAELPAKFLKDPMAVQRTPEQWAHLATAGTTPSAIPAAALGKTFAYDTTLHQYVMTELPGAPANGVRFLLYAVDTVTAQPILPLEQTGYADLSRTVIAGVATAKVEVYALGEVPMKVLEYSASVSGGVPRAVVQGFARNGVDSLTFKLVTTISMLGDAVSLNWRAEVPTQGLVTHVEEVLKFGNDELSVAFEGILKSNSGNVLMTGELDAVDGGQLIVKVNGDLFARIAVPGMFEGEPVVTGPTGEPLTVEQALMLRLIFFWYASAFVFFDGLLAPVDGLLDVAF